MSKNRSNRKDWARDRASTTRKGKKESAKNRVILFTIVTTFAICFVGFKQITSDNYDENSEIPAETTNNTEDINSQEDNNNSNITIDTSEKDVDSVGNSAENSQNEFYASNNNSENSDSTTTDSAKESIVYIPVNPDDYDFSEVISTFTVNNKSSSNRDYNMNLACEKINGMILAPNQEFNWYGSDITPAAVGQATKENGFKEAGVIVNKKPSKGYGGGVCQVATTLYNAIMAAGIEPTEIHHHSIGSTYVQKGKDATVAYNENQAYCKNFVFTNTLDYPIMLQMSESNGDVTATILKGTPKVN